MRCFQGSHLQSRDVVENASSFQDFSFPLQPRSIMRSRRQRRQEQEHKFVRQEQEDKKYYLIEAHLQHLSSKSRDPSLQPESKRGNFPSPQPKLLPSTLDAGAKELRS